MKQVYAYAKCLWNNFDISKLASDVMIFQTQIWYDYLKEYDLEIIFAGMRELCTESDFCNIGKIAKKCKSICNLLDDRMDEESIYDEINRAIGIWFTKDKFDKLSDVAKSVVKTPAQLAQWALVDRSEFNTVVASNIKKSIKNQIQKRERGEILGIKFGQIPFKKYSELNFKEQK